MHPDQEELKILYRQHCSFNSRSQKLQTGPKQPYETNTKLALLQPAYKAELFADVRRQGFSKLPAIMITVTKILWPGYDFL